MNADVLRRATELAVRNEPCPWCTAAAGELCRPDTPSGVPLLERTHMGRFAGLGDPAEYVARHDGPGAVSR